MGGISSVGNARSTQSSNSSAEKNFEIFLAYQNGHDSSWPVLIRDISEAQANDVKLYERYSSWLTFNFESNRGGSPALGTIRDYVRHIGHFFSLRFTTLGTKLRHLDGNNSWMTILLDNVQRLLAQEAFDKGAKVCPILIIIFHNCSFILNVLFSRPFFRRLISSIFLLSYQLRRHLLLER